ncbi:Uncharacterised protein [Salmonella enterica]|nr:Uncharacterised protein [Salmonella enterica]
MRMNIQASDRTFMCQVEGASLSYLLYIPLSLVG